MSGPLDELFGRSGSDRGGDDDPAAIPRLPVHARVLDLPDPTGRVRALAVWEDPGSPELLHQELRARIEGSLLGELSSSAAALVEDDAAAADQGQAPGSDHPGGIHLVAFGPVRDGDRAVAAFGLTPVPVSHGGLRATVAALRHEAALLGLDFVPDEPSAAWAAAVAQPSAAVVDLELRLRREGVDDLWGAQPGAPGRRLVAALAAAGTAGAWPEDPAAITTDVVDALEAAVVPRGAEVIRWIPPMVFQGLCDAVGVAAAQSLDVDVEWGVCAPDEDDQGDPAFIPPPVVRFRPRSGGRWRFVDLGREILRWCVMPLGPDEHPPTLGAWVADAFR